MAYLRGSTGEIQSVHKRKRNIKGRLTSVNFSDLLHSSMLKFSKTALVLTIKFPPRPHVQPARSDNIAYKNKFKKCN